MIKVSFGAQGHSGFVADRVSYGTDAIIPDGPAKGFLIGESITRP